MARRGRRRPRSDRELVVTRTINGPARLMYEAWTTPALFKQWSVPKSIGMTLVACELDVRIGGRYRLVFRYEDSTMELFGRYLDVTPCSRLVWTNDEGDVGSFPGNQCELAALAPRRTLRRGPPGPLGHRCRRYRSSMIPLRDGMLETRSSW
jgi:uncharacterized protein YndB with AHSA1/START domain